MGKPKQSREDFIAKAKLVHGDRFDYSNIVYNGTKKDIILNCKIHGVFHVTGSAHLQGSSCSHCSKILVGKSKKIKRLLAQKELTYNFIKRATAVHWNLYSYDKSKFVIENKKVIITCKSHGDFNKSPYDHISKGQGCPICSKIKQSKSIMVNREEWIESAARAHKNKYDYSKVKFIDLDTPVKIICPIHGEFYQVAKHHTHHKRGCDKCGNEKTSKRFSLTPSRVLEDLKVKFGNKILFPLIDNEYKNGDSVITCVCVFHGVFNLSCRQLKSTKYGCPDCIRISRKEFIEKAQIKFGDRYDYSLITDDNVREKKVSIICEEHGIFDQSKSDHLTKCLVGCPTCSMSSTIWQKEIVDFMLTIDQGLITTDRKQISPFELDIFIPSKKIAVECNGTYYHSSKFKESNYHFKKRKLCVEKGIRLISIWEDEWADDKDKIKEYLKAQLGIFERKINARDCVVEKITSDVGYKFLNSNHLMGGSKLTKNYYGLFLKDELLSIMAFKIGFSGHELQRMVSKKGIIVRGGFSKLLSKWKTEYPNTRLVSYIDMDKFDGRAYLKAGFVITKENATMCYMKNGKRISRHKFKKTKLISFPGYDIAKTEKQICYENKIYQCWNSGTATVVLDH